jgi:hypothetical protein
METDRLATFFPPNFSSKMPLPQGATDGADGREGPSRRRTGFIGAADDGGVKSDDDDDDASVAEVDDEFVVCE